MNRAELLGQIKRKKSMLCVGLDTDLSRIPKHLLGTEDPIFEFNKAIIQATQEWTIAYKPNLAFYEAEGLKGWQSLAKTMAYLHAEYPGILTIADAKRGDIGNTASQYAKAFLEELAFDAITVAPYMGRDSVTPFLQYPGKWVILLALTSNAGAVDFQLSRQQASGEFLFEKVIKTSSEWGNDTNLMYVVGATQAEYLKLVRKHAPNNFLLIPGIGAQGGNLREVVENAIIDEPTLLINSSRGIIYADSTKQFKEAAYHQARALQQQMAEYL